MLREVGESSSHKTYELNEKLLVHLDKETKECELVLRKQGKIILGQEDIKNLAELTKGGESKDGTPQEIKV